MKLHEEFKEYENLWEAADEVAIEDTQPEFNNTQTPPKGFTPGEYSWIAPDGEKVEFSTTGRFNYESEKARMEKLSKGKASEADIKNRLFQLVEQYKKLAELVWLSNKPQLKTEFRNTNKKIIDKLTADTDIADKIDLTNLLKQLNEADFNRQVAKYYKQAEICLSKINKLYIF